MDPLPLCFIFLFLELLATESCKPFFRNKIIARRFAHYLRTPWRAVGASSARHLRHSHVLYDRNLHGTTQHSRLHPKMTKSQLQPFFLANSAAHGAFNYLQFALSFDEILFGSQYYVHWKTRVNFAD